MKGFLVLIFRIVLVSILIFGLILLDLMLIISIKNWVLQLIIEGISIFLLVSMQFIYLIASESYSFNNNEQKLINKCKILESKINNLLFGF
jgi:hypothetical protein